MRNWRVKLVLDGMEGEANRVETGILQGSPAASILFITYLSGIFGEVEGRWEGVKALYFADNISWWVEGKTDEEVAEKRTRVREVTCKWGEKNGVTFEPGKSKVILFSRKRKAPTTSIRLGGRKIPFSKETIRWLGIWLDSHLTLRDHQKMIEREKCAGKIAKTRAADGLDDRQLPQGYNGICAISSVRIMGVRR